MFDNIDFEEEGEEYDQDTENTSKNMGRSMNNNSSKNETDKEETWEDRVENMELKEVIGKDKGELEEIEVVMVDPEETKEN